VFDTVQATLPDVEYETLAAWVRVPDAARAACTARGLDLRAGMHAATHAVGRCRLTVSTPVLKASMVSALATIIW